MIECWLEAVEFSCSRCSDRLNNHSTCAPSVSASGILRPRTTDSQFKGSRQIYARWICYVSIIDESPRLSAMERTRGQSTQLYPLTPAPNNTKSLCLCYKILTYGALFERRCDAL